MEKLSLEEINAKLSQLSGWSFTDGFISKTFKFNDFKETFAVMTRIAFEAEMQEHHPDWSNVYNTLHIKLNTHDVGGITENDFILAERIENCTKNFA